MKRVSMLLLAVSLAFSLCCCAVAPEKEQGEPEVSASVSEKEPEKLPDAPWCALALIYGEPEIWINGDSAALEAAPFTENGVLYLPAADITARLGGSFVSAEDVWYLNYKGNVSVMMEEYNVLLFNADAFIMDSTPKVVSGVFFLPAEGLARALAMKISLSPAQRVCALGSAESLDESELKALRLSLGRELLGDTQSAEIAALAEQSGAEYKELWRAAMGRELYLSDADGKISALWADADGEAHEKSYEMSARWQQNGVFVHKRGAKGDGLYDALTGERVSDEPEELYRQELRAATARYMELYAAREMNADETAAELMAAYERAIAGELENEVYIKDKNEPYDTHVFDSSGDSQAWQELYDKAEVGDFLLFRAESAGAQYGCFNHAALIIEKSAGSLRLLQARGIQYGVGADKDMDILSFETLCSMEYFLNYGTVYLCRAGELDESEREKMTKDAYAKYNGYQFGYGGRMGLEEVNCTELIDEAYLSAGVDIISGSYASRLKEVLKGNTQNLVLIPDDLLFSGNTRVVAVWKRY